MTIKASFLSLSEFQDLKVTHVPHRAVFNETLARTLGFMLNGQAGGVPPHGAHG